MASGKSTFIKENNLEDYTLSTDKIRLMFNSFELSTDYIEKIPQFNNKKVWDLLFYILEERMKKGELTIIDATHVYAKELTTYKKIAEKYRYRLYIIDFTDVSLEELLDRNLKRKSNLKVPEYVIKRAYKDLTKEVIPKAFKIIKPEEFLDVVSMPPRNLDNYKKVNIFGDIHGCYTPLKKFFDKHKISDDEFYIFTGDYFDRGLENTSVFNFIKENISKKNFIFLIGNHEDRLNKYASDDIYKDTYDLMKTTKEFEKNIKKSEIRGLVKGLSQIAYIEFNSKKYIITHGGIPYYPEKPLDFYATNSFIYGVDNYDVDIDNIYNNYMINKDDKIYQVHGHRNYYKIDYNKYEYSLNLDGDIENGGFLRVLTLSDKNRLIEIKNDLYDKDLKEKSNIYTLVKDLRENKYIFEKELTESISSFNFSKEAFYSKVWNNMTIRARGLFIDTKKYKVVLRSYNKFFNINETNETKYETLLDNLCYPANFYLKYNGFLGILSIINETLVFGTKSMLEGTYNDYFRNIFYEKYDKKQIDAIKKRLIKNNTSMIFEVIDVKNDKHIIDYKSNKLVLLDEIYNQIEYKKISYDSIKSFADKINISIKKRVYTANDVKDFEKIYNKITKEDYKLNGKYIEGFVIEDSLGFMVKFKTSYYNNWKTIRKKMETALKNNKFNIKTNSILEEKFMKYLEKEYKDKIVDTNVINIIDERNKFERE